MTQEKGRRDTYWRAALLVLIVSGLLFALGGCAVPPDRHDRYGSPDGEYYRRDQPRRPIAISDLAGRPTDYARHQLRVRGFDQVSQKRGRYSHNTWWYHPRTGQCIHLETAYGEVRSINPSNNPNCPSSRGRY